MTENTQRAQNSRPPSRRRQRRMAETIHALTALEHSYRARHPQEAIKHARLLLLDMLAAAPEGRNEFMYLTEVIADAIAADTEGTPESQAETVVKALLDHVLPLPPEGVQ